MSIQRRTCRLLMLLAGHEFNGLRPSQIADALKTGRSNVSRDLRVLENEGLVEQIHDRKDCWRLGPKLVQAALAHLEHVRRTGTRHEEMTRRYSREPK